MDTVHSIVSQLQDGNVVAMPTETVYGLFADATNPQAVQKLTKLKQRNPNHPYSVMIGDPQDISRYADIPTSKHQYLIDQYMPGPLTLLLPNKKFSDAVVMGSEDVGVRIPDCPILLEVLRKCAIPLVAPSANPTGQSPAQTCQQVRAYFGTSFPVLEGECLSSGEPSTVVRIDVDNKIEILREGSLTQSILDSHKQGR